MNLWTQRCLQAGIFVGGIWILGSGIASAEGVNTPIHTAHYPSALTAPVTAPISVTGNAISLLGRHGTAASAAMPAAGAQPRRSVISAPVTIPITISGNAVAVLSGRRPVTATSTAASGSSDNHPAHSTGSLISAPVATPVTVCGNGVGVLGRGTASCAPAAGVASPSTSGSLVNVPITAPITACGNGIGVLGDAAAGCPVPVTPVVPTPPVTPGGPSTPVGPGSPVSPGTSSATVAISASNPSAGVDAASANRLTAAAVVPGSLAYTGSSLNLLEWLGSSLLLAGLALCSGWRQREA